ncbi:bacteriohemerythrin [Heliorestis acidaminivorans]|nr:bacteriohemerythrin [Heliorestis acidaminivorans]
MLWWTDELASGLDFIDSQHKELFTRVNEVFSAVDINDPAKIGSTFEYLITYVIEHFGDEESYMILYMYDKFPEHRESHNYFVLKVSDLYRRFMTEDISEEVRKELVTELQLLLVEWLVNHIHNYDKKLALAIREKNSD